MQSQEQCATNGRCLNTGQSGRRKTLVRQPVLYFRPVENAFCDRRARSERIPRTSSRPPSGSSWEQDTIDKCTNRLKNRWRSETGAATRLYRRASWLRARVRFNPAYCTRERRRTTRFFCFVLPSPAAVQRQPAHRQHPPRPSPPPALRPATPVRRWTALFSLCRLRISNLNRFRPSGSQDWKRCSRAWLAAKCCARRRAWRGTWPTSTRPDKKSTGAPYASACTARGTRWWRTSTRTTRRGPRCCCRRRRTTRPRRHPRTPTSSSSIRYSEVSRRRRAAPVAGKECRTEILDGMELEKITQQICGTGGNGYWILEIKPVSGALGCGRVA